MSSLSPLPIIALADVLPPEPLDQHRSHRLDHEENSKNRIHNVLKERGERLEREEEGRRGPTHNPSVSIEKTGHDKQRDEGETHERDVECGLLSALVADIKNTLSRTSV